MEGFRKPVGDEPPEVYWRRRITVLVVGVALILLVWFLVSATLAGGGDDEPGVGTSPDPAVTTDAASNDASGPERPCTAEDVTVTTAVSPASVNVGSSAAFDVSIEHTGSSACSLSSDGDGTSLAVLSGADVYYNSAWCTDTAVFGSTNWVLQPGDKEALQTTWSGQRYSEACEPGANGAAGTYRAAISVSGIAAAEASFPLVD